MRRALIGLILIGVVGVISACGLHYLGFLLAEGIATNGVLYDNNYLGVKFLASLCVITFSLAYFSEFKQPSKRVLGWHFLAICIVLGYFANLLIPLRNEQRLVLLKYQEFRQALLNEDYQKAYDLMAPHWRKEHSVNEVKEETEGFLDLGPEDSIYSVHVNGNRATVVPDPDTTWWFRPAVGYSWEFEKVDSQWYVSPRNINFYMPYGRILIN
ncbi:MAG: hypothetical protein AB1607_07255 [Chloroflexota bacterium]